MFSISGNQSKALRPILAVFIFLILVLGSAACAAQATLPSGTTSTSTTRTATSGTTSGELVPITVPTLPSVIPQYLEVDPDTGLHMTGTPTMVDFPSYRLKVSGKVTRELSLTYDELRLMPKITATPTLECEGFFVDIATWSGPSLKSILEMAGLRPDAASIVMKSADGYSARLSLDKALAENNFLAYELEGRTLPVLQGFPLRAVIPDMSGNIWVKWLLEILVE
jgi:DMSO/TMAO reductase YedYZ molybdopterin-dependent catalytic subunit